VPELTALKVGKDGFLTVLLLGSDYRPNIVGERTDVILVMSLDPVTHRVIAASIPRDLVFFPRDRRNGGATSGLTRVNSLYEYYRRDSVRWPRVDRLAMRRFTRDVAAALRIEIDYWAMTRFKGFAGLIRQLGGVRVDIPEAIDDPTYRNTGAYFPRARGYRLRTLRQCDAPRPCHNPLTFVRSRKGTVGTGANSDFDRARRQQEVMMAVARRGEAAGFSMERLLELVGRVKARVYTNAPMTLDAALELLRISRGATLRDRDAAVFGPSQWAYADDETPLYAFRLRVDAVRDWFDERLGTPRRGSRR
jgi:anionic cell wall polymer biosynthesis LytR-Cps2A-Psr (LCP) family protein